MWDIHSRLLRYSAHDIRVLDYDFEALVSSNIGSLISGCFKISFQFFIDDDN